MWQDRTCDGGLAIARHPDPAFLHVAIQLAIPAVLLQEGVEGGEQLGHGSGSLAEMRARTGGHERAAHPNAQRVYTEVAFRGFTGWRTPAP